MYESFGDKLRQLIDRIVRRYSFAIIGAILGIIAGLGIFGIFLGGIIGLLIDEFRAKRNGSRGLDRYFQTGDYTGIDKRSAWLAGITALAGCVLSSRRTMRPTPRLMPRVDRALMTNQIAETFELTSSERDAVEQYGEHSCEISDPDIDALSKALVELSASESELEAAILLFYRVAPGEGDTIDQDQHSIIRTISKAFGLSPDRFKTLRESAVPTDDEAYRILGVTPLTTRGEIKRVYRRLATHFHPDAGSELDDEQQRISEEAFIRIQNAYKAIMNGRDGQRRSDVVERD